MTEIFKYNVAGVNYSVDEPDKNPDKWIIIKEESYRPDKADFVLNKFRSTYKNINVRDADQIYSLASRSSQLNEWLAKTNAEYSIIEAAPTYFRQYVDASDFSKASDEVVRISRMLSEKAMAQAEAAAAYQRALKLIDNEYSNKTATNDKVAKIISLNTTQLPLTIQLAIDNYTPAISSSPNQRTYARECLINYKITLLKIIKKDPDIDVDKLIDDNKEK